MGDLSVKLRDSQLLLVALGLNYCRNRTQHILSHNCHTCLGYWKSMKNREMTSFMFAETARVMPSWRPVAESRVRAELCNEQLILAGKVDLTLGVAEGKTAGKVIIDFKTGGFNATHHEDLRYYALVETLRIGIPPRLVASYYLDQAHFVPEKVTEDLLDSTVRRVTQGVERMHVL